MTAQTLSIIYNGPESGNGSDWIALEQQPVSSAVLTAADLQTMLAMAMAGISARAYKQPGCEAYIIGNTAYAELALYVWPSRLDLAYTVSTTLLTVGQVTQLRQEREFDLVAGLADKVELPFYAENITATWQTPCYTADGLEVEPPAITATPTALYLDAPVFGVLRIRCTACGYSQALLFEMPKTGNVSISNIRPRVTVSYGTAQAVSIDIELPACLESLMAACEDGSTYRDHAFGRVENDETVPAIYYSPCTGYMLLVRNERP